MLEDIIELAKKCGNVIKQGEAEHIETKNNDRHNLVTEYDVKIENILQQNLLKILPEAAFLGEEGNQTCNKNGYCFICDPIDGTSNFINGVKHSCVSIALLKDGTPILGVIYDPYLDEIFWAEKGHGAFCNGRLIKTSSEEPQDSLIVFGTAPYNRSLSTKTWEFAAKSFAAALDLRRSGSAALDLAGVAFVPALLVFVNLMRLDVTQQTAVELSGAIRFFAGMGMTLGLVAVMVAIGVAVPAYRAMRLQPVETLHDE